MFLIHRENIYTLTDASFDVINRTPHWRSHQSRLIGPLFLKILTLLKFSEIQAVYIYVTGMIFFNNFLFFTILSSLRNFGNKAVRFVILFNFGFLIFQDVWLFAWDFLEITFFILYGAIFLKQKGL